MGVDALAAPRWHRLSELIAARTGLHFPPERRADLHRAMVEAAPAFGFEDGDACADWLLTTPLSREQLRKLAGHLTVGETYFFRDRPSFNALATHVLPPLIHRQRSGARRLRLWSAACSTGEEAYSLAILLQQVLPDWRDWDVRILGTDINPESLRKAEAGVYGEWSFRDSPTDFRARYFHAVGDRHWRVRTELRDLVTFAEFNLAQDDFGLLAGGSHATDLILCRNLLIYFTSGHARRLIGNLRHALVDDGWLIVSPSECSQSLFEGFATVNLPGSILYRRQQPGRRESVPIVEEPEQSPVQPEPPPPRVVAPPPLPPPEPPPPASLGHEARELANQGLLAQALAVIERWIDADRLDAAAHYLHAMVLQELGERGRARAALQRAVYLIPEFALAHFALGNHARAEARHAEAQRHFACAARLLRGRPADEPVPESEGLTAGRLREIINALATDA